MDHRLAGPLAGSLGHALVIGHWSEPLDRTTVRTTGHDHWSSTGAGGLDLVIWSEITAHRTRTTGQMKNTNTAI